MATAKKLPSGRWRARAYDHTDERGIRHYKSFTADTKEDAMLQALMHQPQASIGTSYDELTLKQATDRFINTRKNALSASTVRGYKALQKTMFPELMNMKLKEISLELIQTSINEIASVNSPKTVRNKYGLLHKVLSSYAPNIRLNNIRLPQKVKPNLYVPTSADIESVLSNANEYCRVPILLASRGSLRRSEICALTIEDFTDLGVNVNKAKVRDCEGNYVIKQPKTSAGYRFTPLPKEVIKEAVKWKHFGINPEKLSREWKRSLKASNLDFRFHDLRHYWASLLHTKGIPDKYIALYGGWESIQMLHNIYAHALTDKQPEMTNKVVEIFKSEFGKATNIS